MRRRWSLGAVVLGVCICASSLGTQPHAGLVVHPKPRPTVSFNERPRDNLVLSTAAYRLYVSKQNGALLALVDRRTGDRLVGGQHGCGWTATFANLETLGGCDFSPTGDKRFTYRWSKATQALTLRYEPPAGEGVRSTLTVTPGKASIDLQLTAESRLTRPIASFHLPPDLAVDVKATRSVYTPTFLPGLRLRPSFFASPHRNVERYPSRWAFADFLAADVGRSHFAMHSVNPPPSPIAPVDVGVIYDAQPDPCSGRTYCFTHIFQTWVAPGGTWTSPIVRLRVGGSVTDSLLGFRADSGIARFPSLVEKLGSRLDVLAKAPLIKADPWKGLPAFRSWGPSLRRLPSPALLHPVAFQSHGHDEDYPDFLPPDPKWGTLAELNNVFTDARSLGMMVMPYLNVSWWDTQSPSVRTLGPRFTPKDIAMQAADGKAVREQFGVKDGYVVSPYAAPVKARVDRLMEEWRTDAPVECLFFDQIGARPWRRDFNPAAPTPLAYADGWIANLAPYRDRCLMTEDGWDRLAADFVGFNGGALEMEREVHWQTQRFGVGNWEPYPIATLLLHDKVLMYQHDLYEGTFTADPETLLFNVAFGMQLSYNWDGETRSLDSPWLPLVGKLQRLLGPRVAGKALTSYRRLAPDVSETAFGDYSVIANWSTKTPFDVDGVRVAPLGFIARSGGKLLAGALGDTWSGVSFADP
ncbi:MAG: DUF6259 domain-containing protein [Gaiellales bacterium]